jgi:hypothetical protein
LLELINYLYSKAKIRNKTPEIKKELNYNSLTLLRRGSRIRTYDPLVPNQVR